MNDYFCIYMNIDVVGVELGVVFKNIIVLGVGVLYGLGYGDDVKVVLMICGLVEISWFGVVLGVELLIFIGLFGVGDLIVMVISVYLCNWCVGNELGVGQDFKMVIDIMGMVIEGILLIKVVYEFVQ